jgi:hypothetical protein
VKLPNDRRWASNERKNSAQVHVAWRRICRAKIAANVTTDRMDKERRGCSRRQRDFVRRLCDTTSPPPPDPLRRLHPCRSRRPNMNAVAIELSRSPDRYRCVSPSSRLVASSRLALVAALSNPRFSSSLEAAPRRMEVWKSSIACSRSAIRDRRSWEAFAR